MAGRKLLLGVDGGNTKTDLFLFWDDGELAADLRAGTFSNEVLPGGYADAGRALAEAIDGLCAEAGVKRADIDCAVMGLAGVDIPEQEQGMARQAAALGMKDYVVCNDAFLGIKAAAPGGVGICSINGTGTTTVGIDPAGSAYQVGGIGGITSDAAGGGYLAQEAARAVYDEYCRDAPHTAMTPEVSRLFDIQGTADILDKVHYLRVDRKTHQKALCQLLFTSAQAGDAVARDILHRTARFLSSSVAGCYKILSFAPSAPLQVVLAGSVWARCEYDGFYDAFLQDLQPRVCVPVDMIVLKEPPALGAVLWACERACGGPASPQVRGRVLAAIQKARP